MVGTFGHGSTVRNRRKTLILDVEIIKITARLGGLGPFWTQTFCASWPFLETILAIFEKSD